MKKNVIIALFLLPICAFSQDKWEVGPFLGYSNYLGDMVEPSLTFDQANFAGGLLVRRHLSQRFGLRANLLLGKIDGADANYERLANRGADFSSRLVELGFMGEYEFLGHRRWDDEGKFRRIVSPYVFGGLGLAFINPEVDLDEAARPTAGKMTDLGEDISRTQLAVPLGFGIKFDVNERMNIGLDWGWRITFSDYLDGLSEGGNPDDNDVYIFGGVTAGFALGARDRDKDGIADKDDKCPDTPGLPTMAGCPDADGDSITDADDDCPNTPGKVRLNGCPDRDEDGVADYVDDCPDNAGLKRFSGCPDTDSDGIVDSEDDCPSVAGIAAMSGCPDADRDGIRDSEDPCPTTPGPISQNGCPDSDNDGIMDADDACPNVAGTTTFKGCPDTDSDGIADADDKCPTLAGVRSNDGCPEIKKEDKARLDFAMQNVRFKTSSAELLPASRTILDEIAGIMSRYPGYGLTIEGHTDNVGNADSNQRLSERRANSCYDYLVSKGVSASLMSHAGYGETRPLSDNTTEAGRLQNRRVEFTLKPQ